MRKIFIFFCLLLSLHSGAQKRPQFSLWIGSQYNLHTRYEDNVQRGGWGPYGVKERPAHAFSGGVNALFPVTSGLSFAAGLQAADKGYHYTWYGNAPNDLPIVVEDRMDLWCIGLPLSLEQRLGQKGNVLTQLSVVPELNVSGHPAFKKGLISAGAAGGYRIPLGRGSLQVMASYQYTFTNLYRPIESKVKRLHAPGLKIGWAFH